MKPNRSEAANVRWLYEQLPALVQEGVLTEDAADALRRHYGPLPEPRGRAVWLLVSAVLAAALIGLGVVLLVGHHWDELPRAFRVGVGFGLLLAAQALTAWALARRPDSVPWREGAAAAWAFSVAACLAIVSQAYHLQGELSDFLLTWLLLIAPLPYLTRATTPAMTYAAAAAQWVLSCLYDDPMRMCFWPLMGVMAPYVIQVCRRERESRRTAALLWFVCIGLTVGTTPSLGDRDGISWSVAYAALFSLFALAGREWFPHSASAWRRPLRVVGGVGAAAFSLLLTYSESWRLNEGGLWDPPYGEALAFWWYRLLWPAAMALAALVLFIRRARRGPQDVETLLLGLLGPFALCAALLALTFDAGPAVATAFNLYPSALGVALLVNGARGQRLGKMNAGLLLLTALIGVRFFDEELSLLVRGVAFIVCGVGFLVSNVVVARRQRRAP